MMPQLICIFSGDVGEEGDVSVSGTELQLAESLGR
jgi:hypothetical protein